MSTTLRLFECLLSDGVRMGELGRRGDAVRSLTRLLRFRLLPTTIAAEASARLGRLHLEANRFRRARQCLSRALRLRPDDVDTRLDYAIALERDPDGDLDRAWRHAVRALRQRRDDPRLIRVAARIAFRQDRTDLALRLYRGALRLAPDSVGLLEEYVDALSRSGRHRKAEAVLIAARFRCPRDEAIRQLWNDFRFGQVSARQNSSIDRATGPCLSVLRFPDQSGQELTVRERAVRRDFGSPHPAPHFPRLAAYKQ